MTDTADESWVTPDGFKILDDGFVLIPFEDFLKFFGHEDQRALRLAAALYREHGPTVYATSDWTTYPDTIVLTSFVCLAVAIYFLLQPECALAEVVVPQPDCDPESALDRFTHGCGYRPDEPAPISPAIPVDSMSGSYEPQVPLSPAPAPTSAPACRDDEFHWPIFHVSLSV